jgi:hypothetical protein
VLWAHTFPLSEMIWLCKRFPHVSKMSTLTNNWENSVIIDNARILNIIHNILSLRDTEVVIYIILVLLHLLQPKLIFTLHYLSLLVVTYYYYYYYQRCVHVSVFIYNVWIHSNYVIIKCLLSCDVLLMWIGSRQYILCYFH